MLVDVLNISVFAEATDWIRAFGILLQSPLRNYRSIAKNNREIIEIDGTFRFKAVQLECSSVKKRFDLSQKSSMFPGLFGLTKVEYLR